MGRKELLLLSCAFGVLGASPALAQSRTEDRPVTTAPATSNVPSAERDTQAARSGGYVVEELVVTAKEAIDNMEDAPVAVTTFNAEHRNLVAANTIDDLVNLTPGTTISGNGINIRGVGRQNSETGALGSTNGVAYYVNGFYSVVSGTVGESTLYSESVQFFRGPQGTRFGRGVIGGAVSLWARRPTREWVGQAVAQYGDNGFWGLGLNVGGPINDKYGIRFGWQHFDTEETAQANIYPTKAGISVENNYLEFQIEGRPTDRSHFWLRSTTFQYMSDPGYSAPPAYNTTTPMGALVPNPYFGYTTPPPTQPRQINIDTKGADRLTGNQVHILNADYDFGPVTLYYVGGYARYKSKGYSDQDRAARASYVACTPSATVVCAPGTVPNSGFPNGRTIYTRYTANYYNRNQYFTHELRLQNNDTSTIDWVAGAFFMKTNYNERYWEAVPEEAALATPILSFTTFAPAAPNPDRLSYSQRNINRLQSVALFGDVIYHLNDQWSINGGLRYTRDSGRATTDIRYIIFNPAFGLALDVTPGLPSGAVAPSKVLFKYENKEWTGRLGVDYNMNDDTLIYAKYSRGSKPSGFNLGNVTGTVNNVTRPETLNAYEVGVKHTFSPELRGDATAFIYDYRNMQIPISGINAVTNAVVAQYANFDKTTVWGLEFQTTWTPVPALWINANYSYLNAEIDKFCCAVNIRRTPSVGQNLAGHRLPRTPEHKASLSGAYTWDFTPGSLILGGNVSYTAEQYTTAFEEPYYLLPDFTLVNASVTWRSADNQYDIVGQVSNLLDTDRVTGLELNGNNASATGVLISKTYAGPRFWQVQLRYRW